MSNQEHTARTHTHDQNEHIRSILWPQFAMCQYVCVLWKRVRCVRHCAVRNAYKGHTDTCAACDTQMIGSILSTATTARISARTRAFLTQFAAFARAHLIIIVCDATRGCLPPLRPSTTTTAAHTSIAIATRCGNTPGMWTGTVGHKAQCVLELDALQCDKFRTFAYIMLVRC